MNQIEFFNYPGGWRIGYKTCMKRSGRNTRPQFWLAFLYFAWSVLVFFGSLGSESHSWWPVLLYPLIWPMGALIEKFGGGCAFVSDYGSGFLYIVVGTIWVWVVATGMMKLILVIFRAKR